MANKEKRFYVIFPETVQSETKNTPQIHGRALAQSFHIGRLVGHKMTVAREKYADVTTITLGVRNSRELAKVRDELAALPVPLSVYHDENPGVYGTQARVATVICVGPCLKDEVSSAIGHLELY